MRRAIIPNVKIAVVDHEELTREFVTNVMMYSVNRKVHAFDSAEGLQAYIQSGGEIDIVMSDMELPGLTGLELLAFIKKIFPETLFIAMSANPADETAAASSGADAFLAKPFMLQDLFNIVQQFVVEGNA